MPLFAAILTYTDDAERIQNVRPKHREYLKGLLDQGKIVQSGPFTDDSGALIIYEAEDISEAQVMLTNDPFATNGVIVSAELKEWKIVMDREQNQGA
jgi:uncharacterized protein YciI